MWERSLLLRCLATRFQSCHAWRLSLAGAVLWSLATTELAADDFLIDEVDTNMALLDADEVDSIDWELSDLEIAHLPTSELSIPEGRRWTGVLDFVALDRDDGILVRSSAGDATVESDLNLGYRLALIRETPTGDIHSNQMIRATFLSAGGNGASQADRGRLSIGVESDLLTATIGIGKSQAILGGQTNAWLGLRYTNLWDEYDLQIVDFSRRFRRSAVADNQLITIDSSFGGQWKWRSLLFSAELSGGLGANRVHQTGSTLDDSSFFPEVARFDQVEYQFALLSEFTADASMRLGEQSSLRVGLIGLLASNIVQARDAGSQPGETSGTRTIGCTFGYQREF